MKCPTCNKETKVIDSRESTEGDSIRRRRECLGRRCKTRFTTYEVQPDPRAMEKRETSKKAIWRLLARMETGLAKFMRDFK